MKCAVDWCGHLEAHRGYCPAHYRMFWLSEKKGTVFAPKPRKGYEFFGYCSVGGCQNERKKTIDLCPRHYQARRNAVKSEPRAWLPKGYRPPRYEDCDMGDGTAQIPIWGRKGWTGKYTVIDIDLLETALKYRWTAFRGSRSRTDYAKACLGPGRYLKLHDLVMNPAEGLVCDHINHDGLDNRRSNLRVVTTAENNRNRRPDHGK